MDGYDGVPLWCIGVLCVGSFCFGVVMGLAWKIFLRDMWKYETWEDQVLGVTAAQKEKMRRERHVSSRGEG